MLSNPPSSPGSAHHYRSDIDGLRAIAVLGVVVFHFFPDALPGGFIGVDIFFVISGYLISGIILNDLAAQSFSITRFYEKRIRRIFPALIVTQTCVLALGWTIMFSHEYVQLAQQSMAASGFGLNIYLAQLLGYFDTAAETKPLLHLWSLGVEEQFYLIWPLTLLALWRWRPTGILSASAGLGGVSLAICLWMVQLEPGQVFYLPWYRFWELLSGAGLAILHAQGQRSPHETTPSRWTSWIGSLSLLTTLAAMFSLTGGTPYPDWRALIPVLGTALIIGAPLTAWVNRHVLSQATLVSLGKISYPLYLWHWPLLAFVRISEGHHPDLSTRLVILALAIGLAILTYRGVEQFFRQGGYGKQKTLVLLGLMLSLGGASAIIWTYDGLPQRYVVQASTDLKSGSAGYTEGWSENCGGITTGLQQGSCIQDTRPGIQYLLLGDSKAAALFPGLIRTSAPEGRWMFIGKTGEPDTMLAALEHPQPEQNSERWLNALHQALADPKFKAVALVIAIRSIYHQSDQIKVQGGTQYNPDYFNQLENIPDKRMLENDFRRLVHHLVKVGKQVIVVADNPALPDPADCAQRVTLLDNLLNFPKPDLARCHLSLAKFQQQIASYTALLKDLKASHPESVQIVDPTHLYCNQVEGLCHPTRDSHLLYSYTDHISDYAAGLVGQEINERLAHRNHQR